MRNHHAQSFQGRSCREELCGLVGREFFGDPPAADDWTSPVTLVYIQSSAFERGLAGVVPALADWDHIPDLPAVHEAQLLLARGACKV